SRANPHLMALRVTAQVLSEGVHTLTVTDALDGSGTNPGGVNHWGERKLSVVDGVLCFDGTTNQSGYQVAMRAKTTANMALEWQGLVDADGLIAAQRTTLVVSYLQKVTFSKIVAVHTTRDTPNPGKSADYTLSGSLRFGYEALKNDHQTSWAADWDRLDVIIEGDEVAQLAVRFSTYHVMIAVPTQDERVSIGAKTLSGFGYKG